MAMREYDDKNKIRTDFVTYRDKVKQACESLSKMTHWNNRLTLCNELAKDLPTLLDNATGLISKGLMTELTTMLDFAKVYQKSPTTACIKLVVHLNEVIDHLDASQAAAPRSENELQSEKTSQFGATKIIVITATVLALGIGAFFALNQSHLSANLPDQSLQKPETIPEQKTQIQNENSILPTQQLQTQKTSEENQVKSMLKQQIPSNNPPILVVPSDVVLEATSSAGAIVKFNVKGMDIEDGKLEPNCNHSSDSEFPLGKTVVSCYLEDSDGNNLEKSFTVDVRDTTPPEIGSFETTDGQRDESGVIVYFSISAIDAVDGQVDVLCDHDSGSKFPIGTTTITCNARDSSGNEILKELEIIVDKPE